MTSTADGTDVAYTVQAIHRAVRIPGASAPYDTAHVTVHYPALVGQIVDPTGTLAPALTGEGRLPVVVFASGMNCDAAYYRWLATRLARKGFAAVTYGYVGHVPPAQVGLTAGVDVDAVKPDTYGTRPVGLAWAPILELMAELDADGPLAGAVDTSSVAFGGHSAGGTVALESASQAYFPAVKAVFSLAAHTMASTVFGWEPGTVLPLSGDVPVFMVHSSRDGLVASAAKWYGEDPEAFDPIGRSFDTLPDSEAAKGSWLVRLEGANHFSVCAPEDHLWPRAGEDLPATVPGEEVRDLLAAAISVFLKQHLMNDPESGVALANLLESTPFVDARSR
jgi:pimeloyl-ACP methyl ester carboxylesterase